MKTILKNSMCIYILSLFIFNNSLLSTNYISMLIFIFNFFISILYFIKKQKIVISKVFIWFSLFVLFGLISIVWSENSSNVSHKIMQLLINLYNIFIITNIIETKEDLSSIIKCFFISGIFLSVITLVTSNFGSISRYNRLGSQIGNSNIISFNIFCSLVFTALAYKTNPKKIYILGILLMAGVIIFSGSRKTILMLPFVFVLYLMLNKKITLGKKARKLLALTLVIISIVILCFSNNYLYSLVGSRIEDMFFSLLGNDVTDLSINNRNNMIVQGIEWFKDRKWFGYGLDNYCYLYLKKYGIDYYAHNNYVELLVDLGIFGIIIYYSFFVKIFVNYIKSKIIHNEKNCLMLSFLISILIMDYAKVSYGDRVFSIVITIIYLLLMQERVNKNEKSISNNVHL